MGENPNVNVLYKMGEKGSAYYERKGDYMDMEMKDEANGDKELYNLYQKDAFKFSDYNGLELVDTTGAGDSFTAAYAVAMLEGKTSQKSLEFANQVAFLTVSQMGAGPAMPTRNKLEQTFGSDDDTDNDGRYDNLQDHSFIGVIRHAEKANLHDKDNPRWKVKMDPPLSRRGDRQAAFTGMYLK